MISLTESNVKRLQGHEQPSNARQFTRSISSMTNFPVKSALLDQLKASCGSGKPAFSCVQLRAFSFLSLPVCPTSATQSPLNFVTLSVSVISFALGLSSCHFLCLRLTRPPSLIVCFYLCLPSSSSSFFFFPFSHSSPPTSSKIQFNKLIDNNMYMSESHRHEITTGFQKPFRKHFNFNLRTKYAVGRADLHLLIRQRCEQNVLSETTQWRCRSPIQPTRHSLVDRVLRAGCPCWLEGSQDQTTCSRSKDENRLC